jgi:pyrrolysyl-tRNA synthetase-like protein
VSVGWSEIQSQRLAELNAEENDIEIEFESTAARDHAYQEIEKKLVKQERNCLKALRASCPRSGLSLLENRLADQLTAQGFTQVSTPIIMSKGLLARMGIDDTHPLAAQIFWLGKNKCLRPMLAPHLYYVLKDLLRNWDKPVRLFEIGPCFRKESKGSRHSDEFTMLNLVEMGLPEAGRGDRLRELATLITRAAGVTEYEIEVESSEVYGETLDVVSPDRSIELASGAMGPHPLDRAWNISETWVGIGFGLERLLMAAEKSRNLKKLGRSLTYLNGIRLNV